MDISLQSNSYCESHFIIFSYIKQVVSTTCKINRYPQPIINHSTIFKTFDSDIDKISSKWGMFGRSFNDIGTAIVGRITDINKSFQATDDLISSIKDSDSIWKRLYPSKESIRDQLIDIDSLIPEIDKKNFDFDYWINELNDVDKKVKVGILSWQDYSNGLDDNQQWIAKWGQETEGQIRTQSDLIKANKQSRASTLAHNEAIKEQTFSAKAGKVALQALVTVGNMFVGWAISKGIELVIKGIDRIIHSTEYAEKAIKAATDSAKSFSKSIKDIQKETADMEKSIDSIIDRYAELSQGVNTFTNENKSLPTDQYEEFLGLNKQPTELFPSLTRNYDENGIAILGLSGSVDSVTESIRALVEQEKELARAQIRENLEQYFEGTDEADGAWMALGAKKQKLEEINEELVKLQDAYDGLIDADFLVFPDKYEGINKYLEFLEYNFGEDVAKYMSRNVWASYTDGLFDLHPDLVVDFSSLKLTEWQKEQVTRSYDMAYGELLSKQKTALSEFESQNSEFSNNAMLWLEDLSFYKDSGKYTQTAIQNLVRNIDWSNYNFEELDYEGVKRILQASVLTPFQIACEDPNTKKELEDALNGLFTIDVSDMHIIDIDWYTKDIEAVSRLLNINPVDIKIDFGLNDIDDNIKRLKTSFRLLADDHGIADRAEYEYLLSNTKDLTLAQIDLWLEATRRAENAAQAIEMWKVKLAEMKDENPISLGYVEHET